MLNLFIDSFDNQEARLQAKGFFCNMIFRQLAGIRLTVTTERPFESDLLDFYSHLLLLASSLYAPVSVVTFILPLSICYFQIPSLGELLL